MGKNSFRFHCPNCGAEFTSMKGLHFCSTCTAVLLYEALSAFTWFQSLIGRLKGERGEKNENRRTQKDGGFLTKGGKKRWKRIC